MNITQTSLILVFAICSVTLIGVLALMRNTESDLNIKLKDTSVNLKTKRSLQEKKEVDCLPGEGNSQPLNCDSK